VEIAWKRIAAEFVATLALVFVGAGSVLVAGSSGSGLVGVALAHGAILAAMVAITAPLSGGLANPAVTLAMWVAGRLAPVPAALYAGAQVLGAVTAAALLRLSFPETTWRVASLGTPIPAPEIGGGKTIVVEATLTLFLALVYLATPADEGGVAWLRGLAVGLTLAAVTLVGWPLTGAAVNPARAFGPALLSGTWTMWWAYWLGPAAGAAIAAGVHWALLPRPPAGEAEPGA
jgi:aquaporin Z